VTPDAVPLEIVAAVLQGGCRWLQYRDKGATPAQKRERAQALAALCRQYGAALLINDDVELALAVGAAGVHLGRDDGDIAAARARLGAGAILGASCYNEWDRAVAAAAAGADYLAFGAVHSSPTKPAAARAPLDLLGRARQLGLPVCAIGGITLDNAPPVIAAGADLLAVITDLFAAADPCGRAAAFQSLFQESAP
jgi:thiamine-phosphate pyrophosphorylase